MRYNSLQLEDMIVSYKTIKESREKTYSYDSPSQNFTESYEAFLEDNKKIVSQVLKIENNLELSKVETFKKFIKNINYSKSRMLKLLKKFKKSGKKIHCYGASTKGNVLLQYYNIDHKIVDFAAERNKNKYGLFTPGTKIKIISEVLSRFYNPDYYIVLPWHFKNEILVREKDARKKGTKFIFPLPNLKII